VSPLIININLITVIISISLTGSAIIGFICIQQSNTIIALPVSEIEIITVIKFIFIIKGDTRINPYPPSFNKIAAKIIDPTTGAST
jgi:hypothetical protein